MDEYPQGANVLVAVISYTGYDMEDAMIINKATYERGFGHGSVYKTFIIDLDEEEKMGHKDGVKPSLMFCNVKRHPHGTMGENDMAGELYCEHLDIDGLPEEGMQISLGDPIACFVDEITGSFLSSSLLLYLFALSLHFLCRPCNISCKNLYILYNFIVILNILFMIRSTQHHKA